MKPEPPKDSFAHLPWLTQILLKELADEIALEKDDSLHQSSTDVPTSPPTTTNKDSDGT